MKRIALAITCVLVLSGCSLSLWPARSSAKANHTNLKLIVPAYKTYLEKDVDLSVDSKKIRKRQADEALNLAKKMEEKSQ